MRPRSRRCRSAAAVDSPIKKKFPPESQESERDICAKIKLMCPPKAATATTKTAERRSQRSTVALQTSVAVLQAKDYKCHMIA